MPDIGWMELLVIGIVALIVVGPKDLPLMLRKVGRAVAKARAMANEFRASFDEMARQSELDELRKEVNAALTWFNARENASFAVTGIVDPSSTAGTGADFRLVLCCEGVCRQETFEVSGFADLSAVRWLGSEHAQDSSGVAELDPPPGARRRCLKDVAGRNAFAVEMPE